MSQMGRCGWCGNRTRYLCGKCKNEWYCNKTCQRAEYERHRVCCGADVDDDVGIGFLEDISGVCENQIKFHVNKRDTKLWNPNAIGKKWVHTKTIGGGSFGTIDEYETEDGKKVVVKFMKLGDDKCITRSILNELCIRNISHPNVAATCGICRVMYPGPINKTADILQGEQCVAMVMEKMAMDLEEFYDLSEEDHRKDKDYRPNKPIILPDEFAVIAYQIIRGIAELHSNAIIHSDIKPGNVLIGNVKISDNINAKRVIVSDLGLSLRAYNNSMINMSDGTPGYIAPEILFSSKNDFDLNTMASDIWACGATLYEIATGEMLFDYTRPYQSIFEMLGRPSGRDLEWFKNFGIWNKYKNVFMGNPVSTPEISRKLKPYPGLYDIFHEMMQFNPASRPKAHELLKREYFSEAMRPMFANLTAERYVELKFPHTFPYASMLSAPTTTTAQHAAPKMTIKIRPVPQTEVSGWKVVPEPRWILKVLGEQQIRISGAAHSSKKPNISVRTNIENTHFNTILQLMKITSNEKGDDYSVYAMDTLFKAITLLNMLRGSVGTVPTKTGSVVGLKGYLADVLYMIARKSYADYDIQYDEIIEDIAANAKTNVYPIVEEWVLKKIDYDVGRPSIYDVLKWKLALLGDVSDNELMLVITVCLALSTDAVFLQDKLPSDVVSIAMKLSFPRKFHENVENVYLEQARGVWGKLKADKSKRFAGVLVKFSLLFAEYNSKRHL